MLDVPPLHLPPPLLSSPDTPVHHLLTTTPTKPSLTMLYHAHAHSASISSGMLVVDGVHLQYALDHYFPQLAPEETPVLLQGLFECLETAFGVSFKHRYVGWEWGEIRVRGAWTSACPTPPTPPLTYSTHHHSILHECSATPGQPTALGTLMAAEPFRARVRTHQLKARSGAAVNPHTWEPVLVGQADQNQKTNHSSSKGENTAEATTPSSSSSRTGGGARHETATLLLPVGLDVGLSLDLLRHTTSAPTHPNQVVVVLSARPELAETLEVVAVKSAVYVLGLKKEVLGTPLAERVKPHVTLDGLLASAAETLLWARRRKQKQKEAMHARAEGYYCPRGSACDYLRGTAAFGRAGPPTSPTGTSGNQQTSPRPFTAGKLEHLTYFVHPCGGGRTCRNVAPYHQAAFPHHSDAHNTTTTTTPRRVNGTSSPVRRLATTTTTIATAIEASKKQLPWMPPAVTTPLPHLKVDGPPAGAAAPCLAPPGWGQEKEEDWLEKAVRRDYYGEEEEEEEGEEEEAAAMASSKSRRGGKTYWWQRRREEEVEVDGREQLHDTEDERDAILFPMSL